MNSIWLAVVDTGRYYLTVFKIQQTNKMSMAQLLGQLAVLVKQGYKGTCHFRGGHEPTDDINYS